MCQCANCPAASFVRSQLAHCCITSYHLIAYHSLSLFSYDDNRYHPISSDWCGSSHRLYKGLAQILAFVVIWVVVPLLFLLVASLLTKAMEAISLGWLNRWLGAGLGALKFLLLVSLLICVVEFIDSDNTMIDRTMKEESVLYYPIESFAGMFFPAAKEVTEQYILNT